MLMCQWSRGIKGINTIYMRGEPGLMSLLSCYRMPLLVFCNFIMAALHEHTDWQPWPLFFFFWCFFTGQIVAIIEEQLQEKSEAAWLADLTNVTVFDNRAFTSCSKDIQGTAFKVMLMELIWSWFFCPSRFLHFASFMSHQIENVLLKFSVTWINCLEAHHLITHRP